MRLLDQMEFELEELEAAATEGELRAEQEAAKARTTKVASFTRKRPSRLPFPEHLPRELIVLPGPDACTCCGGTRLAKLGETVTESNRCEPATEVCGRGGYLISARRFGIQKSRMAGTTMGMS